MKKKRTHIRAKDIKQALFGIRPSLKNKGVGVFALRNIKKGTRLCDVQKMEKDFFVSWEEFNKIDPVTQRRIVDFCAQDKDGYYGPIDMNYLSIPLHMNHHCHGNVGCDARGNFVAIKGVKKDEELCFDYALVISNPTYTLKCTCGDLKCRKTITGNDWKRAIFQKKNYKIMSPFLRRLVTKDL